MPIPTGLTGKIVGASKASLDAKSKLQQLEAYTEPGASNILTTNQGLQIPDNHNSLKAGGRGPTLLEDFILREKITHFDHERIPERAVHARGSGVHGGWMTHCHSPHARFSPASDLWIADRVRNDQLLYWMLSRSFLKFKNGFSANQGSKLDWCAILAGFICSGL